MGIKFVYKGGKSSKMYEKLWFMDLVNSSIARM